MTEATKIYIKALNRMNKFVSWEPVDSEPFTSDEQEEEFIRTHMLYIAKNGRWKREARIARGALKEVSYLKMGQ